MVLIIVVIAVVAIILDALLGISAFAAPKEGQGIGRLGPQLAGMALATLTIAVCVAAVSLAVCSDSVLLQLG